jgi:hypothetical protein
MLAVRWLVRTPTKPLFFVKVKRRFESWDKDIIHVEKKRAGNFHLSSQPAFEKTLPAFKSKAIYQSQSP